MRDKRFKYTYKITLLKGSLAGKYYFGQHSTDKLEDGYAGSGTVLKNYYKKYGRIEHQTYIKEIIGLYNTYEELNIAEELLVGERYKEDIDCLNCRAGGNNRGIDEITAYKQSIAHRGKNLGRNNPKYGKNKGVDNPMYGKHHTLEARRKVSEARKTRVGILSSRAFPINQLSLNGDFIKRWDYAIEAAKCLGMKNTSHISQCINGKRKSAGGFKWEKA